jgi:hypothetical protein
MQQPPSDTLVRYTSSPGDIHAHRYTHTFGSRLKMRNRQNASFQIPWQQLQLIRFQKTQVQQFQPHLKQPYLLHHLHWITRPVFHHHHQVQPRSHWLPHPHHRLKSKEDLSTQTKIRYGEGARVWVGGCGCVGGGLFGTLKETGCQ